VEYFAALARWKSTPTPRGGQRSVILIGGDLHFGVRTQLRDAKTNEFLCKQVITSAISNDPPPRPVYWLLRQFMRGKGLVVRLLS
jgi:hypothetical protein